MWQSLAFCLVSIFVVVAEAQGPTRRFPLESATGIRPHNVTVEPATLAGQRGVRVTMAPEAGQRLQAMTPDQRDAAARTGGTVEQLALVEGVAFGDGTIEVELAGTPETTVFKDARGFVGIAPQKLISATSSSRP
jgi:hypothetical protein